MDMDFCCGCSCRCHKRFGEEQNYLEDEIRNLDLSPHRKRKNTTDIEENTVFKKTKRNNNNDDSNSNYNVVDDDPPIYLRAKSESLERGVDYTWHVIKPGNNTPQDTFLGNILPTEPKNQYQNGSAVVSVGSRIYLIGGLEPKPPEWIFFTKSLNDVFYIDTNTTSDHDGQSDLKWKKGPPLIRPVAKPFAVALNNYDYNGGTKKKKKKNKLSKKKKKKNITRSSVFVSGPYTPEWDPEENSVQAQVLRKGSWHNMNCKMPPDLTGKVTCHVLDNSKCMLVHSLDSPDLYKYNLSSGEWALGCKNFECHSLGSALVDGILYFMDGDFPGEMFAVDTTTSKRKKIPVKLKYTRDGFWWFPQRDSRGSSVEFFMVPLGNHRLAIIWYAHIYDYDVDPYTVIWCTRWEVSKANSVTADFELKAYSRARYYSDAKELVDCLPIF